MMPFNINRLVRERIINRLQLFILTGIITGVFMWVVFEQDIDVFIVGTLIGSSISIIFILYNTYIRSRLSRINIFISVFINFVIYLFLILFVSISLLILYYGIKLNIVIDNLDKLLLSKNMLYGLIFGIILSLLFNFNSLFNTLLGKNFLLNILIGKYRKPFQEERAFMFLDLKSSTTIAEKIGHENFLSFLNDFFFDLAEPVLHTKGEIYKYVGDEAIITWKMNKGVVHSRPLCLMLGKNNIVPKDSKND